MTMLTVAFCKGLSKKMCLVSLTNAKNHSAQHPWPPTAHLWIMRLIT